jgi:hypothetical protein
VPSQVFLIELGPPAEEDPKIVTTKQSDSSGNASAAANDFCRGSSRSRSSWSRWTKRFSTPQFLPSPPHWAFHPSA